MCGINAIFAYGHSAAPIDEAELLRTRDHMRMRGPDGADLWISNDRRIGLGHRRLAIIDTSESGAQPMRTHDGRLAITFNGEIYNYRSLRRELEAIGYRFRSQSDTEVLLHLYAERGADMVHALRGMYAFAIWDEPKGGLFLARDPFGIKPLYYTDNGGTVRVASQVKALLASRAVPDAPEAAGHVGFHLWGHVPEPYTLYKAIRALEAGTSLWIDRDGNKVHRQFFSITEELRAASESSRARPVGESYERLRSLLADSVSHHLIADVPVGVFLSAGVDSTVIAALASENRTDPLITLTLGFEEFKDTPYDEAPMAEATARRYGTQHQTRWINRSDFIAAREHLLDVMDQPSADGVNSYFICKVSAQAGLKVALSGLGGDEFFAGYPSFTQVPLLARTLGHVGRVPALGTGLRMMGDPLIRRVSSPKYAGLFEYGSSYEGAYLLRRGMFMPWELRKMLDPEMAREGLQELQTLPRLRQTHEAVDSPRAKITALESAWYMRNQLLRDTDWAGMAHSLEVRTPFIDIELFRGIAPMLLSGDAPGKGALAELPDLSLPPHIAGRKKTGFMVPVDKWLGPKSNALPLTRGLREWAGTVYRSFTRRAGPAPVVVVFRTGQLGDTLVALPAIERIRRTRPHHRMVLLTDKQAAPYVCSWEIFEHTGWFERAIFYDPRRTGWSGLREKYSVLLALRALECEEFFNLQPSRTSWQKARDKFFFSTLARVRRYRPAARQINPPKDRDGNLPQVAPEWLSIASRVDQTAFDIDDFRLAIPEEQCAAALQTARGEGVDLHSPILAIGPGSKMPAKVWPAANFLELGARIREHFPHLQIVILGGKEDVSIGRRLCSEWGKGTYCLAGRLSLFGSAALLQRCAAYVGNDTGTMHLAAMVGVPCVGIFSARDHPGRWNPFGVGHTVLRRNVDCAGCMLEVCTKQQNKCLTQITVDQVLAAVRRTLAPVSNRNAEPRLIH